MAEHMPAIECPHCAHHDAVLVSHVYSNGSVREADYRCSLCDTKWTVNRQGLLKAITFIGMTTAERHAEIKRFAALQNEMFELHKVNAPAEWYRYIRT